MSKLKKGKQKVSLFYVLCYNENARYEFRHPHRSGDLRGKERGIMIDITRMNGKSFTLNSDLIEIVEESPDTVVTLTTGKKIIVKESRQEIKNLVKSYRKEIFQNI